MMHCTNMRTNGWLVLLLLPMLAACVTGGEVKPEVTAAPPSPAGAATTALEDGRHGFIITETPAMDEAARRDFEQAVSLMNAQAYGEARELLATVVARAPGVTAPHINLAIACRHLDRPEEAEEQLKAALRLVPEHPAACTEYGLLCRKAGRFAEAREMYEKVLARYPDYYPARRNLGILCDIYLNDAECAIEQYALYSAARPEDPQVKIWLADLRNRVGAAGR